MLWFGPNFVYSRRHQTNRPCPTETKRKTRNCGESPCVATTVVAKCSKLTPLPRAAHARLGTSVPCAQRARRSRNPARQDRSVSAMLNAGAACGPSPRTYARFFTDPHPVGCSGKQATPMSREEKLQHSATPETGLAFFRSRPLPPPTSKYADTGFFFCPYPFNLAAWSR